MDKANTVTSARSLGARIVSAITGRVKALRGDLSRNVSDENFNSSLSAPASRREALIADDTSFKLRSSSTVLPAIWMVSFGLS